VKPLKQHIINIQIKTNHIYIYRTRYIHDACVESNNMVIVDDLGGGGNIFCTENLSSRY
jgi:hypothetical protein